jgi:hypothetical protein
VGARPEQQLALNFLAAVHDLWVQQHPRTYRTHYRRRRVPCSSGTEQRGYIRRNRIRRHWDGIDSLCFRVAFEIVITLSKST